jgi:hypothetical protein
MGGNNAFCPFRTLSCHRERSEAISARQRSTARDCFVALLLAMTRRYWRVLCAHHLLALESASFHIPHHAGDGRYPGLAWVAAFAGMTLKWSSHG